MKERIRKIAKKSKRYIIFGSSSLIFAPLAIISTTPSDGNAETNQFDPNDWTYNNRFNMFSNVERFGYQGIQSRNQTTEGWKNTSIDDTNRYVKMENTFSIDTDSTVNNSSDNIYNFRSDREKVKVTFGETDNIVNGVIGFALSPDIDIVNGTMKYKVSVINTTDNTVESTEEITIANDLLVSKNQGTYFNSANVNQRRNLLSSTLNVQLSHFWVRRNYVVEGDGGENAGGFLHNRFLINNHEATTVANTYGVLYLNRMRQQPDYGEFGGSTGSMFTTYVTNNLPQGKRLKIEAEFETFKRQNPDLNFNNDNRDWNQTSYWKYSRFQTHIMAAYRMTSAPAGTMSVFGQFVRAERPKYMRIETGVKFNTDVLEERQYTGSNKLPNYTMPDTVLKIYQTVNGEKKLIATKDFTNISGRESAGDAASTKNGTLIDALYFDYDFNSFNRKVSAGEISYEFTLKNESDARFFKVNPGSIKFNGIWWTDNWREYQDYRLRSNTLTSTSGDFALDKFGISLSDDELKRNQIRDNLADKTNLSDAQKAAYEQWIAAQENLTDTQVEEANQNVDSLDAAQENAFINIDNLINLTTEEKQALKDQILNKTDFLPTGTISEGATVPTAKSGTFVNPRLDEIVDLATAKNEIKNPNSNIASEELTPVNEVEEGYEEYKAKKDLNDLKEQARTSLDNKLNELQSQIDTLDNLNNATSTNNNLERQIQNEEAKLAALNNLFDADRYNDLTLEQKQDFVNRINALDPSQDQDAFNEALESIKTDINRQEAIHDLGKLKDLNDAQKQAALTAINNPDATSDEIAIALENATNQNEKMTALKELVKTQLNVLSSGDDASTYEDAIAQNKDEKAYEFATAATKTAYDTDLTNATSAATNNGENLSPEQIQALIDSLTNSYETLTNESTQKQEDIADRIAALNNLSEAQREALTNSINENTNLEDALAQLEKAEALNSAIPDLKQAISDAEDKKQESIYLNDSSEKQTALDNALEAAKAKLAQIQADTNMSSDNLELLSNDITPNNDNSTDNTIEALTKADQALDGNRQALRDKVDALSDNFSEEDKETLKEQIGALSENPTEEEINNFYEGLKQAATQKAKDAINALENLSDGEKTAYKAQIDKAAENLDLANSETSPIDKALSDVVANAKGQDQERQDALDAIDALKNLSEAQKAAFKNNVQNATTPEEIQAELNKAKDYNALDAATGLAAKRAESAKESNDYKFADPEKQKAYNNALKALQDAIGDDATNTDPEVLKELNKALNKAKAALNGDEKLEAIKNNIDALENLSDAQKQAMKDKVDASSSLEDAQNIEEQATNLDEAISSLKDAIDAAKSRTGDENANPAIPADSIYTLDDPARKEAVDNALAEAEIKLAQLQNLDLGDENTNIDSAVEEADSDSTTLNNAIEALDGNRHALKQEIADKFGTLSPEALAIAKNDVNDLDREFTEEDKQNLLNNIFADAQVEAKNVIDNIEVFSPAEIKAFKDAIDAATINNAEGENFDKALADILEQVKNAKALKDAAIAKIDALENLSDGQKTAFKNNVKNATTPEEIQAELNKAKDYNALDAATGLAAKRAESAKESNDYKFADPEKQKAYNDALKALQNAIGDDATNTDPEVLKELNKALNKAKAALNGDENLETIKNNIDALENLSDAQKQAMKDKVDASSSLEDAQNIEEQATNLDEAISSLKDAIDAAKSRTGDENANPAIPADSIYTLDDPARKEAVDNALAEAEVKLAQLQNLDLGDENTNIDSAVEAADFDSTALNDAIEALDGNRHALKQEIADKFGTLSPEALAIAKNDVNDLDREFTEEDKQNLLNNIFADAQVEAKNVIDNIEGLSPAEVKAFKDAIDAATINNTEGENFDKALADILEQAKNAKALKDAAIAKIDALENLNDAQKQALKNSVIDSPATDAEAISEKAAALDEAMKAYKDEAFADNPISKTDNDYILADENNKAAFDNALENRDELFGQNGANLDLEVVKAAHEALKAAREALNGDEKLQAAKDAAIAKINGDNPEYASLTDAQKQAAIDAINAANNLDEVSAADAANSATNAATKRLKDYINNADTVKAQKLYTGSEENLRNAYDQSIEDAKAALAKLENPDTENLLDVTVPKTASDDVHSAVAALNGDTNIAQEKQAAKDAINALENLNDAQKAALIEQVDSAIHPEDVRGIKAKAQALDTKMGELKASLEANSNANVKQSIDYLNSDNTNENPLKNNYDQALNNADLMADAENGGAQLDEAEVQKLIDALNNAKDALNGQEKFDEAKNEAIAAIDALENLNDAQKAAAKAALENANLIADLEDIASDAKTLDTAMGQLKNSLDAYNAELENNPNYTEASEEPKQAYDDANNASTNATDKASGTALDLASVVALQKQLSDAKNNLDGHQSFLDKKAALIEEIQNDPNLNQNQKDQLVKAAKAAETSDNLNNIQDNKNQLSEAMAELRKVQEKAKDLLDKPVYANSSEEAQNALDDAITNNEPALDKDEPVAYDLAKIQELIQATNNAIDNLDGNDRLDAKKQEAKDAIDALENLNDAQKAALKEDIDNAELISDIDDILDNASKFNDTMGDLINYNENRLGDAYKDKTSRNYLDADKELKNAYDAALEAFNNALNNENANITDSEALSKLLDDLKAAKAALNGEAKRKMLAEELAKLLAESDSVKAQDLYAKNSDEKQNAYDLAIAEGTFDYKDRDNLSLEEIKAAAQQIKDAKEVLKDNSDALKGLIDNLENLNDAEKAAFKAEIDKYDNYQDRIAAYDKALALDKSKVDLNSYIDSLNNLSDADKALLKEKLSNEDFSAPGAIENFKDQITNANDLLEKLTNPNLNKDLSNEDLDNIKNALSNLGLNDDSYAKLADALKVRNDINDALEAFRNSDYGSENYAANKDKLNDLIAKTVEFSSDNATVQNAISNLKEDLDKHQMAAEAEMGIVDSILNGDKEEFERFMVMLDESNSPLYGKLSEALATSGFFENSNNNFKGLTKEQITILKNLNLGNVSHVIQSAYDQALKGATSSGIFRWWLLLSLTLLTLGFWAFMIGRKKNKDL